MASRDQYRCSYDRYVPVQMPTSTDTMSSTLLYEHYAGLPRIWGLDPIDDQNAGGAIMMVEQSLTFVIALVVLFAGMLTQSEADEVRRERLEDGPPAPRPT